MFRLKRWWFIVTPLCFLIVGCSEIKYVDNQSLDTMGYTSKNDSYGPGKRYGALVISNKDSDKEDPTLIMLKRHKSSYVAETKLSDSHGDEKALFDESYISVGADQKERGVILRVRFVY